MINDEKFSTQLSLSQAESNKTRVFNDQKVTMTLRLDPILRAEFELAAKSLDRSSAALVRELMREAIKKYKQKLENVR